ncbi:fibroblast growth factor receptor 2-like isoform X2 [Actinia tenebrosa]|uniref:receptor protein-tyrosine kinase n=1 Tax=Actinia tenebrosa TaxID=6105 RepID=A0A6P8IE08_ACTTE|nr:fibroblast growth factor receptor 2-like isoform X2 [Actinia tenebrosa]
MANSGFLQVVFGLLWVTLFLKAFSDATASPKFTTKPNNPLVGFQGEAVNFTWEFSNHSISKVYFGVYKRDWGTLGNTLIWIASHKNGSVDVTVAKNEPDVKPYIGRMRWVGDLSQNKAAFELSPLLSTDKKFYGIEVEFGPTTLSGFTELDVKMLSNFTLGAGTLSVQRGQRATFAWRYDLNKDDIQTLSSITFGVYKNGEYKALCLIKVKGKYVESTNCSTGIRNPDAHHTVLESTKQATFVLSAINLDDEAVYSIRLGGTLRNMENKILLIVTDPPKITQPPKSTTIIEGKTLNLTCAANGKPRPVITWLKDSQVVQENYTEQYVIRSTERKDDGKYYCVAENEVGKVTSGIATVDVQYAPIINISSHLQIVRVPIGRGVLLRCPVSANPEAKIEWLANGILEKRDTDELYIFISNSFDYANYTCKASNSIGKDYVTFVLQQVGPPSVPRVDCEKREDSRVSRVAIFHWLEPKDDGGAPVLVYTVKHRILKNNFMRGAWSNENVTNTRTWYKFNLQWQTTFEFSVTAWNIYGESKLDPDNSCIVTIGKEPKTEEEGSTLNPQATKQVVAARKGDTGSSSSASVLVYVGPIIALVVIVAVVAVLIHRRRRKRGKRGKREWNDPRHFSFGEALSLEGNVWGEASANDNLLGSRSRTQSMVGSPCYQMDPDWTIPREKICILKVIGNGAFGLVYKGRVHGKGPNSVGWNLVAIKSPYADATDAEIRDLMKEFELLKTLKPHPHVIRLLGCGEDEGRPLVVIEYVPFGDLLGYLRKSRGENDDYYSDPEIKPNTNLSSQQLLRFGWHVADGMAYLASEKIIHRDLAARNVLVGEGLSCKVTDFGMAKDVSNDDIYVRTTEGRLPVKWTAIEALTGSGEYTTKSDVWSFGVVLYEICTIGAEPYAGLNGKEIPQRLDDGYRMPRPGHVDPELYDVMTSCWESNPDDRPTFPELKETLIKLEEVQTRDYINLSECLYQNVKANGQVRLPKRKSFLGSIGKASGSSKEAAKGNAYHMGPEISASNVGTAV